MGGLDVSTIENANAHESEHERGDPEERHERVPRAEEGEDASPGGPGGPWIEVGWILDHRLEPADREAVQAAHDEVLARFRAEFPRFRWSMPVQDQELGDEPLAEPVELLEAGAHELAVHRWDLVLVVTGADLRSHLVPVASAAASRALCAAVLSTSRLDPKSKGRDVSDRERVETMHRRTAAQATYLLERLVASPALASRARVVEEPGERSPDQLLRLREGLERIADERVEEEPGAESEGALAFHARAAWRNRREILENVRGSSFWQFPVRLGRLTAAAVSATAILLVTAESWQIAAQLSPLELLALGTASVVATTLAILERQRLWSLHGSLRRTEQMVVLRVSGTGFVLGGVVVTFLALLATAFLLASVLFHPPLLAEWASVPASSIGASFYLSEATFLSSLAVVVGVLGASFEGSTYLRHVAYVDEELPIAS